MKKIMMILLIILAIGGGNSIKAQQLKFYYYPQSNFYYDPVHKQYIYSNNGSWSTVKTLPTSYAVKGARKVVVYSETPEVWQMNSAHVKKYQHYPEGKAVGYKGTNPNKAQGKANHQKNGKSKG
jgi:hypothetical protein